MKNSVRRAGLTIALVSLMLLPFGAAPANASPGSCTVYKAAVLPRVYGACWTGSGSFSVWAECHEPWGYVFRQSAWVRAQLFATADVWCRGSVMYYGMYQRN